MAERIQGLRPNEAGLRKEHRMPDEELGNLISAVGNHEGRALFLTAMQRNVIYDRMRAQSLFRNIQGPTPAWRIGTTAAFDWCEDTLSKIGLVTREVIDPSLRTYGFIKTDYGFEQGDALAGHLLSLSEQYPTMALYHVFGKTGSSASSSEVNSSQGIIEYKKRSPILACKIFWELITSDRLPLRVADLAVAIQESNDIFSAHFDRLGDLGIVDYNSTIPDQPFGLYKLSGESPAGDPQPYHRYTVLTKRILDILQTVPDKELTIDDVVKLFLNSPYAKQYRNFKIMPRYVSHILAALARQGYIERVQGVHAYNRRSEINLSPEQREFLVKLMTIIDSFQMQDKSFLKLGRQRSQEILSNPSRVAALAGKAREASSSANASLAERTAEILEIVLRYPNGCTAEEIQRNLLAQPYNRRLSKANIRILLNKLKAKNRVRTKAQKTAFYWVADYE